MARAGSKFIVHFSTLFSTTRTSFREKTELCSLADLATLGFAISLMTSASVALADCFFVFLLSIYFKISRARTVYWSILIKQSSLVTTSSSL
jgi:hypothetical protein